MRIQPGQLVPLGLDVDEPDVIWMYQLYADREALETRRSSPAMDRLEDRLDELLAHEPEAGARPDVLP